MTIATASKYCFILTSSIDQIHYSIVFRTNKHGLKLLVEDCSEGQKKHLLPDVDSNASNGEPNVLELKV